MRYTRFAKGYDAHAKHSPHPELVEGPWFRTAADAKNPGLSPKPSFDKLRMRFDKLRMRLDKLRMRSVDEAAPARNVEGAL